MATRKTFEEKSYTKLRRLVKRMRKDIYAISYDFGDSDMHPISADCDTLLEALDDFEARAGEEFEHYKQGDDNDQTLS